MRCSCGWMRWNDWKGQHGLSPHHSCRKGNQRDSINDYQFLYQHKKEQASCVSVSFFFPLPSPPWLTFNLPKRTADCVQSKYSDCHSQQPLHCIAVSLEPRRQPGLTHVVDILRTDRLGGNGGNTIKDTILLLVVGLSCG